MTQKYFLVAICLASLAACARSEGAEGEEADGRRLDAPTGDGSSGGDGTAAPDARGADAPQGMVAPIQSVRDGTVANDTVVTLEQVLVTAVHVTDTGNVTLYVQEPDGETAGGHTYPEYAGVAVYLTSAQAAGQSVPAVGACVDVTGTVDEYYHLTELMAPFLAASSGCGSMPSPYVIGASLWDDVATDSDMGTAGDQAGALAEAYEGVLVKIDDVTAVGGPDAMYHEVPLARASNPTGPILKIDDFLYDAGMVMDEDFASITGIYTQFSNYKLQPRSAADVVE